MNVGTTLSFQEKSLIRVYGFKTSFLEKRLFPIQKGVLSQWRLSYGFLPSFRTFLWESVLWTSLWTSLVF